MRMETKPILQTIGLTKDYKGFKAVDNLFMTVYEGDVYGFVGENGAGKTTLIRLVTGLTHPTQGEYSLFGTMNTEASFASGKKNLAAIVEKVSVNRGLSAIENIRMQCKITGAKKTEEEMKELLRLVGLGDVANAKKRAGRFSLGMRQRLGLAIALVSDPKFVILDEPMNGLDPQGFIDMRETILRLNKLGVTFLISSHILSELDKVCNRVGFLSHGRLLEELSIADLRDKARGKIVIGAKNVADLADKLKDPFKLEDYKVEGDLLTIYDKLDVNDVLAFLVKNKIKIDTINSGEETIVDNYYKLMHVEVRA